MEPHARQSGALARGAEPLGEAVRVHGLTVRLREHVTGVGPRAGLGRECPRPLLAAVRAECHDRGRSERHGPCRRVCLARGADRCATHGRRGAPDPERAALKVHVPPQETGQLAAPEPGRQSERPQPPERVRYVIGLDLGLKNDRTALAVCHAEGHAGPPRIVLDRLHTLSGTRERPVRLADVEAVAYEAATAYAAPTRLDPWQAVGLAQRLRARGVTVTEWTFSPVSVGRLAMTLHLLLRERRLALPDDADLLDELATVRLRESRPGVYRLDHDAGQHDDRAVALGLAALALTERPEARGSVGAPARLPRVRQALHDARPEPPRLAARQAAQQRPRGLGGQLAGGFPSDRRV